MSNRSDNSCQRKRLALEDAIPDLIIGMIGIPVGFSLQAIAEVTLHHPARLLQGLLYFVFVVFFYGLYSTVLYMSFEFGRRIYEGSDKDWQRYLLFTAGLNAPFAIGLVGTVLGIGLCFQNRLIPVHPAIMGLVTIAAFAANCAILTLPELPERRLLEEFPVLLPGLVAGGAPASAVFFVLFLLSWKG